MNRFLLSLLMVTVAWPALAATRSVTFTVTGWTCGSCAASTRIALKKLDGVEEVKTDHQKMEAAVTYDDSKVTPEKMVQAIQRLGYKATVKAAPSGAASPGSPKGATVDASPSVARRRVEVSRSSSLGRFRCRGRLQGEGSGTGSSAGHGAGKGAAGARVRALVRGE